MAKKGMFKICLVVTIFFVQIVPAFSGISIREPFVAGTFYPLEKKKLEPLVDYYLQKAPVQIGSEEKILALVAPHAGFIYSGETAGYAYKNLNGRSFDTVVLIGPYHQAMFHGVSVWSSGIWKTPLGEIPVDAEMAAALKNENLEFATEELHLAEHSLETQLPFLQKTLSNFKILPILISDPSPENTQKTAEALLNITKDKNVLFVISTDMSHYFPLQIAGNMDFEAIRFLKRQDESGLLESMRERKTEFCGAAAVLTLMRLAKMKNGDFKQLHYDTSANFTRDASRVVGYGALAVLANSTPRTQLLALARNSIEAHLSQKPLPLISDSDAFLQAKRAVFVTLRKEGALRGCIGNLEARSPLGAAVQQMAIAAATQDGRFSPLTTEELPQIKIEISILSPLQKIESDSRIVPGSTGVWIRQGTASGVFLPQVWHDTGWSKEEFLSELCSQKAGLARDCWKNPKTEMFVFTVEEFA